MRRLALGLGPAALLVLVSLWEIVATARSGSDVGDAGDWQRAADFVRERAGDGDLIVFAPRWIDPIGRHYLGDSIPVDMAARMDAARYGTVWELAVRGAHAPEATGREVERETFGPVSVRKLEREPVEVVTDFVDAFAGARVEGKPVRRSRDRSVPPAVDLEEVGFEPHRCVRFQPPPNGTVRVVYEGVTLGSTLVGYAGLADVFTRRDHREPGRLDVDIDGARVASIELGIDDGWVRFEAPTRPAASATVVFSGTAVGAGARDKLICFAAEARR